jgi:hypothetical protein
MHPGVVVAPGSRHDNVKISSHSTVMARSRFGVRKDD